MFIQCLLCLYELIAEEWDDSMPGGKISQSIETILSKSHEGKSHTRASSWNRTAKEFNITQEV